MHQESKKIKFSIIVPVYNTAKFLDKNFNSIIKQSYSNFELIFVNDGSTDDSKLKLESYKNKDNRVHIINQNNMGLPAARNKGISKSQGDYIIHIDSDDWIENNYLYNLKSFIDKYNPDMLVVDIIKDYGGNDIEYIQDFSTTIINKNDYLRGILTGKAIPSASNKIYKKKLHKDIKFLENCNIGEDLSTTPLLILKSKSIIKINNAYLHYMQTTNGMTKNEYSVKNILSIINVIKHLENNLKDTIFVKYLPDLYFRHVILYGLSKTKLSFNTKQKTIIKSFLLKKWILSYSSVKANLLFIMFKLIPLNGYVKILNKITK